LYTPAHAVEYFFNYFGCVNSFSKIFKELPVQIKPLTPGASTRQYFRITGEACKKFACTSLILAQYGKNETVSFNNYKAITQHLLGEKFNVPQILKVHSKEKVLLLQDIGSSSLYSLVKKGASKNKFRIYQQILKDLAKFHRLKVNNLPLFKRKYDRPGKLVAYNKIFRYDFSFHTHQLLFKNFYKWKTNRLANKILNQFYDWVCRELSKPAQTLMYRDLQSSNIFRLKDQFYYIDFQDARLGIPHYDLAALLWDTYIPIQSDTRVKLVKEYQKYAGNKSAEFDYFLRLAVIQRKLHDAGAFANAVTKNGKMKFKSYIQPAVNTALQEMKNFKECRDAYNIINTFVRNKP